jgi:hypothetical protein
VVNDYLLVVALDAARDEHLLAFDSPLHVEKPTRANLIQRPFRLAGGAYWVEYGCVASGVSVYFGSSWFQ